MDIEDFDPELMRRYDVSGPRYTSYPTARQFATAIDAAAYRSAVTRSNEDFIPSALSLYLHLPFCSSPCFYCGCSRLITRRPEVIAAYLERLHREVALQGQCFDRDRLVRQLHFGGGTPTYLTDTQLAELFEALRGAFSFANSGTVEFAIEVDPRSVDAARIAQLAALGFNRVSYGFQDFDPAVQQAVNRIQDPGHCVELIGAARAAGFRSVSVDLIYGLPCQTEAGFAKTLRSVAAARPDRVAVYGYAHMPSQFKAQRLIRNADLPDANLRLQLLTLAVRELTAAGYLYIGMDHFALPDDDLVRARDAGTLQRNFQGYSTLAGLDLVGIGLTAIGHVGDVYAQNAKALNEYYTALDAGRLAVQRGYHLTADDRARADIIGRLMCYDELHFADIERVHDLEFKNHFAPELGRLAPLAADGLLRVGEDGIAVLPRGRFLRRALAMVFDAYLPPTAGSNSYSRVI
ncbi:MAG TPA: oxygen-independent coproporphyrinogen III oxidase [Gammaproteobacteria bacterium]|nr:oxygen-independent coproporphyrinogen III oxidase [Gammaproteobacteria bacterium]